MDSVTHIFSEGFPKVLDRGRDQQKQVRILHSDRTEPRVIDKEEASGGRRHGMVNGLPSHSHVRMAGLKRDTSGKRQKIFSYLHPF